MQLPPSGSPPAVLATSDAVRLFLDRARSHNPDLDPDDDSIVTIADICRSIDALPLTIELAAALVRVISVRDICAKLGSDRFRLLRSGPRTSVDRHRTLEATLEWGYELLPPAERLLLSRLCVFAGGFSLEAAERVCSDDSLDHDDVLDVLTGLVDRSFVVYRPVPVPRYQLLETVRDFAQRKLAPSPSPSPRADGGTFRREGDLWTVDYLGVGIGLRDAKGLRYLHALLSSPGREFHVADLAGGPQTVEGDTGEIVDHQGRDAYRRRIEELSADVDDALAMGDDARASILRVELDTLTEQLAAAYGLGGRARTAGDPVEKIRKAVTNRIRTSMRRITADHPALGRHLSAAVRTGTFCSYQPETDHTWTT
jgi:hypothetical protein